MGSRDTFWRINWQKEDASNFNASMKYPQYRNTSFALLIFTLFEAYFVYYILPELYETLELYNVMDLFDEYDEFED